MVTMMMEASGLQVAKVERAKLKPCITCPLCHRLFVDATTISECLHTFCRKCIYEKMIYEYLNKCPVCRIYLGCAPLEKLRVDNSLQDLRYKIFPSKRREFQEHVPEIPLPFRRKERSISSLVVSTARVSTSSSQVANTRPTTAHLEAPVERVEDPLHEESLADRPSNVTCSGGQSIIASQNPPAAAECSRQQILNRTPGNNSEAPEEKSHFLKRFGHLIQYVSKTKPNKFKPRKHKKNSLALEASRDGVEIPMNGNGDSQTPSTSAAPRPRRPQHIKQKRPVESEGSRVAQAIVDANRTCDWRLDPIWFSLVASEDQGDARLPQIASSYLRIKDGNLAVAYIKRYVVQKLGLSSENEVKISMRGQPVRSTVPLQNLVDWWVQTSPVYEEATQTSVGSSGKDFVMVLSYSRNVQQPL